MIIEAVSIFFIALAMSLLAAHQEVSNLRLRYALVIGMASGLIGSCAFILLEIVYSFQEIPSWFASLVIMVFSGILLSFLAFIRDPKRVSPDSPDSMVSPADGRIIYIRDVVAGTIPCAIKGKRSIPLNEIAKTEMDAGSDFLLIGICMSILDVHITRIPFGGSIQKMIKTAGKTVSPKSWQSEVENPRTTLLIDTKVGTMGVIQMGTPLVSRIIDYVSDGQLVEKGQKMGRIKWGSQVDLIIPKNYFQVTVAEGDQVFAGLTIIAKEL